MNKNSQAAASWGELYHSGVMPLIVLVSFGAWLHGADELMVSTIAAHIIGSIGGEAHVAWLMALYEIGCIVAAACAALAVLAFGLARSMSTAAVIYGAGCLMSGFASGMEFMLAGRLLQGLGGGAMIAVAFVAIQRSVPEHLIARAYAVLSIAWGFAAFAGPMTGALFAEAGVWRHAFYFYAAQAFVFAAFAIRILPAKTDAGNQLPKMPWRVLVLAAGVIAIAQAGVEERTLPAVAIAATGLGLVGLFFRLDSRHDDSNRMLPKAPWNFNLPAGAAMMLVLFMAISTMGFITYGPLLLFRLHGIGSMESGALLLLESVGWSVTAIFISGISPRYEKRAIAIGLVLVAGGTGLFAHAIPGGVLWLVAVGALAQGGGFGLAWSFMLRRAILLADPDDKERIASAIPTTQRLGYGLGAAFAGMVANGWGFSQTASQSTMEDVAIAIFMLSMIPAAIGLAATARLLAFEDAK